MYQPKHALARAVAALSWRAKTGIVTGVALSATAGAFALGGVGSAAAVTYPTPGPAGEVHLGLPNLCLDNTGNSGTAGTAVQIWKCLGDNSQQWQFWPDGTLRPVSHPGLALGLSFTKLTSTGRPTAVLQASTSADSWTATAVRGLIDNTSSGGTYFYLNDPGWSTANGTKLIGYPESGSTGANEQWTPPGASYATSKLVYRPDSGGGGDSWALDTITRMSSALYEGDSAAGVHQYAGAVADTGTFVTVAGNLTPNQGGADKGLTLGDDSTGTMSGVTAYSFTSSTFVTAAPPASAQGVEPIGTSDWYKLWFAAGTTFAGPGELNSGPLDWTWSYHLTDNCGKAESWTDADPTAGQGISDGNITAPALSSC